MTTPKLCVPYVGAKHSDITQIFGNRQIQGGTHLATDFAPKNAYGKFLLAPELCEVKKIETDYTFDSDFYPQLQKGYGIRLQSLNNPLIEYLYWHTQQTFLVRAGQIVPQGEPVANIGNSGFCYSGGVYVPLNDRRSGKGSHLHFEMSINGVMVDVTKYIDWTLPVKLDIYKAAQQKIVAIQNLILNRK